jgi:hypothetical protein
MRILTNNPVTIGVWILLSLFWSNSLLCFADQTEADGPLAFNDFERAARSAADRDTFSRIYRADHGMEDKRADTQFSRIYRAQSAQPSFSRILRGPPSTFSRILRGAPVSFSRILRSGENRDSLSRILRSSELPIGVASGEDEKQRLSRILRTPEFSRLLRSQTFSRILKRSGIPEEEAFLLDDNVDENEYDFQKRMNDFSRINRSPPSFSRIL